MFKLFLQYYFGLLGNKMQVAKGNKNKISTDLLTFLTMMQGVQH